MKKKRLAHLCLAVLTALALTGCGTNKELEPYSELILRGADPPSFNVGVNPPLSKQTYFVFTIRMSDANLSLVPADAWTLDNYQISYSLLSDTGHHLVALPAADQRKLGVTVKPNVATRLPITIVTDAYLRDNASGFIGTSDTATVKARLLFKGHRNKDGAAQTMDARFIFTIGNF
jgi:hypothetical protein